MKEMMRLGQKPMYLKQKKNYCNFEQINIFAINMVVWSHYLLNNIKKFKNHIPTCATAPWSESLEQHWPCESELERRHR